MNLPLFFVLPILLASGERQDLPVTVKSYDPSCKNHIAADNHPSLSWVDDKTAIVRVRVAFQHGVSASDESPGAYLEGKRLNVCYNIHVQQLDPHGYVRECLAAEDLEFTVSELSRGDYSPHVSRCNEPKSVYYKCVENGKTKYSIYEGPNCIPILSPDN